MTRSYLALGSNLNGPKRQLNRALIALKKRPGITIEKKSKQYMTRPLGGKFQPMYCNQVIAIQTRLRPQALLELCQAVEKKQHRLRKKHHGSRTLDIDILLYGNQIIKTRTLSVPHPEMYQRDFVLIPLSDISPL